MSAGTAVRRAVQPVAGGGGASVFVNDTFTGADNTTLQTHAGETGAAWTKHPNSAATDAVITSNALRFQGSDVMYYASGTPATAEYDVEADVKMLSAVSTSGHFITGRHDTAANTFYGVRLNTSTNTVELYKRVAGTFTSLGTFALTYAVGTTYHLKLQIRNATKKVFVDGVERISSTDNAITGAGRVGLRGGGNDPAGTGQQIDNLVATNA